MPSNECTDFCVTYGKINCIWQGCHAKIFASLPTKQVWNNDKPNTYKPLVVMTKWDEKDTRRNREEKNIY